MDRLDAIKTVLDWANVECMQREDYGGGTLSDMEVSAVMRALGVTRFEYLRAQTERFVETEDKPTSCTVPHAQDAFCDDAGCYERFLSGPVS
jgi:hypothetical protein